MAQYKDCDKCYHCSACAGDTDKWNYFGECPHYVAAADVALKSEFVTEFFEELDKFIKANKTGFYSPHGNYMGQGVSLGMFEDSLAELKKKCIEE